MPSIDGFDRFINLAKIKGQIMSELLFRSSFEFPNRKRLMHISNNSNGNSNLATGRPVFGIETFDALGRF